MQSTRYMTDDQMKEFVRTVHIEGKSPMSFVAYWRQCAEHCGEAIPPQVEARYNELVALGHKGVMFQRDTIRSLGVQVKGNLPVDLDDVVKEIKKHGLFSVVEFGQRIQLAAVHAVRYKDGKSKKSKEKYDLANGTLNSFQGLTTQQYAAAHAGIQDNGQSAFSDESDDDEVELLPKPPVGKKLKTKDSSKETPTKGDGKTAGTANLVLPSPIKSGARPCDLASPLPYHGHCGLGGNQCGWGHCGQCISFPGAKECTINDRCGWFGTCKFCKYIWENKNQS